MATKYEGDFAESLARLETEVKARRDWLGVNWVDDNTGSDRTVKVLDYACGPGTVSRALLGLATKYVGLDVSDGMIAQYNKFASSIGFPPEKMHAQQGNLVGDTVPDSLSGPEFFDFDFVGVGMALHHFADPELSMKRFAARTKKGGVCLVTDLVPGQNEDIHQDNPEVGHVITRNGFGEKEMREMFASAGFTKSFDYQVVQEPLVFTMHGKRREMTVFMAKGELE
ncbi:hypothetical protein FQN54_004667 [Arachnomyces sp. PD_36]|nr:hypothetical protein FQN54_004667 [Arachnomyces sp. PD_36]